MYTCSFSLILASGSPRRKRMLAEIGLNFRVVSAQVDEVALPGEAPEVFVRRLAEEKAREVAEVNPGEYTIGADTVVVLEGRILGKPRDVNEAKVMLANLSGNRHQVYTGFSVVNTEPVVQVTRSVVTEVEFCVLAEELINAYVATGEPLDKAGSYGIQGRGGTLVRSINGSYSNVVGLPMVELIQELLSLGIIQPALP
ncbi:MAG: septum formation inhibitor Maf [Proteobacteria bacterium]|nr:septum formation inhibitor Maf [Pseudomonadota bacterium]MBU1688369.1 septum formation inhibitor Maf [Pseudomonadota bacterium]